MSGAGGPLDRGELIKRFADTTDGGVKRIHGLLYTGSDDVAHYYVAVWESENPAAETDNLNIRYLRLGTVENSEDTLMKNGISIRDDGSAELPAGLAGILKDVLGRRNGSDSSTRIIDVTGGPDNAER